MLMVEEILSRIQKKQNVQVWSHVRFSPEERRVHSLIHGECNDSINNVGSQGRVNFGAANQPRFFATLPRDGLDCGGTIPASSVRKGYSEGWRRTTAGAFFVWPVPRSDARQTTFTIF